MLVPIQTFFQHTIFVPISSTISCIDTMNSGSRTSLYLKNCSFKPPFNQYNEQNHRFFSPCLVDTWRKEYKSRTFKLGQYLSALPRDVSAHSTRPIREQKKLSKIVRWRRMCFIPLLKIHFPHQMRYLIVE